MLSSEPDIIIRNVVIGGTLFLLTISLVIVLGQIVLIEMRGSSSILHEPEYPLTSPPRPSDAEEPTAAQNRLHSYGWVDEDTGIAHIPIARAMTILAEESMFQIPRTEHANWLIRRPPG